MVLRHNVPLKAVGRASRRLLKSKGKGVSIPLPKLLEKYGKPANDNASDGQSRPRRVLIPEQEDRRDKEEMKETKLRPPQIARPNGLVEKYLRTKVPDTYALHNKRRPEDADHLFESIPAYISCIPLDGSVIFRLWPLLNQLLPPDEMNLHVTGNAGMETMYSWTPTRNPDDVPSYTLHLGRTLPMYVTAMDPRSLLFDGTDSRFLPGPAQKWPYRLWASGSIKHFVPDVPRLNNNAAYHHVLEKPVKVYAARGMAKITIRKTITSIIGRSLGQLYNGPSMLSLIDQARKEEGKVHHGPYAVEEYKLIFFKDPPPSLSADFQRTFPPPKEEPEFRHTLNFNRHHLFAWSGVTQNAHLIHLDKNFAMEAYKAKDLVVQGSFIVFLILEWLRRVLTAKAAYKRDRFELTSIDYRIILPIFVDEEVTFCARPLERAAPASVSTSYEIWIQKPNPKTPGGVAKTLTAKVEVLTQKWDSPKASRQASVERDLDLLESDGFSSPFFRQ